MDTNTYAGPDTTDLCPGTSSAREEPSLIRRKFRWLFSRTAPYLGALGAVALAATLLATMYFTWLSMQWVTFLSGILVAAVLSIASRSARAEWLIARRNGQLTLARDKLARESRLRSRAEQALAQETHNIKYLDELMPAMLAHVDADGKVDYHNRAFRLWLGLSASHIENRPLAEILGATLHADFESGLRGAEAGYESHRECSLLSKEGEVCRLLMQAIPQFDDAGSVTGLFLILTDITRPQDVAAAPENSGEAVPRAAMFAEEIDDAQEQESAERLKLAIEQDGFCLYSQSIKPLAQEEGQRFCEVLLRRTEEEEGLMPPGTFLQLAEQYGMLPDLDRWAVKNLLTWISGDDTRRHALYSLNVSSETMADGDFPEIVRRALIEKRVPGGLLCFEFQEADVMKTPQTAAAFIAQLKRLGCSTAICGVGGNRASFEVLKQMAVDYIKIDGSLVLNMLRSAVDLARVKAIHSVARTAGVVTIAECVEDGKTLEKLHALGVDYAQGFGVSLPRRLDAPTRAQAPRTHERMAA